MIKKYYKFLVVGLIGVLVGFMIGMAYTLNYVANLATSLIDKYNIQIPVDTIEVLIKDYFFRLGMVV